MYQPVVLPLLKLTPTSKAGLSLGEYTAIVAAGVRWRHGGIRYGCERLNGSPVRPPSLDSLFFQQTPREKHHETPGSLRPNGMNK